MVTLGSEALEGPFIDLIGQVLQKGQVSSTRNRRGYMNKCINVDEGRGICKGRSRWRSVVSAYPYGKYA